MNQSAVDEQFDAPLGLSQALIAECYTTGEVIRKGAGNNGVYVLKRKEFNGTAGGNMESLPEVMVKKYCRNTVEFEFAAWLLADGEQNQQDIGPEVYACFRENDELAVVMQFLPDAGRTKPRSKRFARLLSRCVLELNKIGRKGLGLPSIATECRLASKPLNRKRLDSIETATALQLGENLHSIDQQMRLYLKEHYTPVLSHGDLSHSNVFVTGKSDQMAVRLFDFGLLGYLTPGAEFHHFANRALRTEKDSQFFEYLIQEYSKGTGVPANVIRMAANLYALDKELWRTNRQVKRLQHDDLPARAELIRALVGHAQTAFSELG